MTVPSRRPAALRRSATGLPVLDPTDVLDGYPAGRERGDPPRSAGADPVAALRTALRTALVRPPCVVAFSGGRDSSLVLAVAADEAARAGLAAPVAFTLRYPGDAAAEESAWQELMIGHLRGRGLPLDWERRAVTDELDLVGPLAAPVLRGHGGPTHPAAIAPTVLLADVARGGTLVTGNFGDEVLGDHRAATLRAVWRRRGRAMTASDRRATVLAAAPGWGRRALLRGLVEEHSWLRDPARAAARERQVRDVAAQPLRWDASVRAALHPRAVRIGVATRERIADDRDCVLLDPLGSVEFVTALARFGGRWGRLGRTAATRALGGELVPAEVAGRRTKASFNGSRFGPASREFARRWSGAGVDPDLVDVEELRRVWCSAAPHAGSAMLLQQAWVADGCPR